MSEPYYADDTVMLYHGDCIEVLREMPDASVDAVCTDPPYGLEFMGREWDSFGREGAASKATAGIMGGGHSATNGRPSFLGGLNPRCLACGRSQRGGSPCSCESPRFTDERGPRLRAFQQWCQAWTVECLRVLRPGGYLLAFGGTRTVHRLTCAVEDAGFEIRDGIDWIYAQGFPKSLNVGNGRGTALKPAREPIAVARKPLAGTVAANVLAYGTGALNIDACRVAAGQDYRDKCASVVGLDSNRNGDAYGEWTGVREDSAHAAGRWPSNIVFSHAPDCNGQCVPGCPVGELDRQSGGEGGASRFFPVFRYEAKAPTLERPRADGVAHPTVKPLDLMRWLVRLVTPPGGIVLEPFAGSGTTAEACVVEGFRCIAIEREADYLPLIVRRLSKPLQAVLPIGATS